MKSKIMLYFVPVHTQKVQSVPLRKLDICFSFKDGFLLSTNLPDLDNISLQSKKQCQWSAGQEACEDTFISLCMGSPHAMRNWS